jgi:membrane-bound lytic murein transglycosylase B
MLHDYRTLLGQISKRYHVQPEIIVALWGIESDFGAHPGKFSVIQSLATLAYEGRRREFFTKELMAALKILQQENMRADAMQGSWAGAMGGCQFMPSTYLKYASDGDHDGHRDIWTSTPDVLASIASYLHALGWNRHQGFMARVDAPESFFESDTSLDAAHTRAEWLARGVTIPESANLGPANTPLYGIYVGDADNGLYLVTNNYKAVLEWNRSRYFATAVGTLAAAIRTPE